MSFPLTLVQPGETTNPEGQIDTPFEKGRRIKVKDLVNALNFINFQDKTVLLTFRHRKYRNILSVQAKPQPCTGRELYCTWSDKPEVLKKLKSYEFSNLVLSDGQRVTSVEARETASGNDGISLELPDYCNQLTIRKTRRLPCEGIQVQIIQHGIIFNGHLVDFNGFAFGVNISAASNQTFQWLNPECPVYAILGDDIALYSDECRIIRHSWGQETREYIMEPLNSHIRRFRSKKFRSQRYAIVPSPNVVFIHPLSRKLVTLDVEDLGGSGVAVMEPADNCVLLPGMLIPEMYIEFASDFKIHCKAQVVSRVAIDESAVKSRLAYLDMDVQDHSRLASFLHKLTHKKSYVCNKVDLDELWRFFFETGFVYPQKYAFMHSNKQQFKKTYEKLYTRNPSIAKHFIFQDSGTIHAHMSMIRFYRNTWMIHHHAASSVTSNRAGVVVLEQIGRYVNEFHRLYSGHMNYLICYFRPENKFPKRVFGGAARHINNPKGCSLDSFAYFHHTMRREPDEPSARQRQRDLWECLEIEERAAKLSEPWKLLQSTPEDISELGNLYEFASGGLMLSALDLEPDTMEHAEPGEEFRKLGFRRERHLFSLKRLGELKAVIVVNRSDVGLNMSDLTDCVQFLVIDSDDLPPDVFFEALSNLSGYYQRPDFPILLYPLSFAEKISLPYDKVYNLWVLNTEYLDGYFQFVDNLIHRIKADAPLR